MTLRVERKGPVFTVVLSRPERKNAVDRATAHALSRVMDEFEADEGASVAVLYGEGGTFCAGADLKAVSEGNLNDLDPDGPGPLGPTRRTFSKPLIAAVEGHAVAGGLELSLLCDLRVAAESAVFGVFCRRWGVPLIDGGTIRPLHSNFAVSTIAAPFTCSPAQNANFVTISFSLNATGTGVPAQNFQSTVQIRNATLR